MSGLGRLLKLLGAKTKSSVIVHLRFDDDIYKYYHIFRLRECLRTKAFAVVSF